MWFTESGIAYYSALPVFPNNANLTIIKINNQFADLCSRVFMYCSLV